MTLPVNIDATYADSGTDASVKLHQQFHDSLHGRYNTVLGGDPLPIRLVTAATTLALTDAGTLVRVNTAGAVNVTILTSALVVFPVGTIIEIEQAGPGQVTILGATGVTLLAASGLKTRVQYSAVSLLQVVVDTWRVSGDATP